VKKKPTKLAIGELREINNLYCQNYSAIYIHIISTYAKISLVVVISFRCGGRV